MSGSVVLSRSMVVEDIVEKLGSGIALEDICCKHRCLYHCGVQQEINFVDYLLDDLRLGELDLHVLQAIVVDSKVLFSIPLVFRV